MWTCAKVKGIVSGVKVTDLRPLPKPAPHGVIPRFIYETDGGMMGEKVRNGAGGAQAEGDTEEDEKEAHK